MSYKVIIIPIHGQLSYAKDCIAACRKYTKNPTLIVIDDGSPDAETRDWLKDNEKLFAKLIVHDKATGFTKSVNDGIDYAMDNFKFNCLCLMNSDAEPTHDGWFDLVEDCFIQDKKIGIAGVMSDNALAQTVKNKTRYFTHRENKPIVYSFLLHGFCYFISYDLLMKIGHLDEIIFPHYGSEDDYSLKSIKAGFKNLLVGSVFVHHNNETSYTHDVRAAYVKKSLPTLVKRWGKGFVEKCAIASMNAAQYVNNKY